MRDPPIKHAFCLNKKLRFKHTGYYLSLNIAYWEATFDLRIHPFFVLCFETRMNLGG